LLSLYQQHRCIIYVRSRCACHYQSVTEGERIIGIVVIEHLVDDKPLLCKLFDGIAVSIASCRIGGAIGAVRADRKNSSVLKPCYTLGGRKRKLLIASALTFSDKLDHRFTAGYKGERFIAALIAFGNGCHKAARFSRLAGKAIGENNRLIAKLTAGICRSFAKLSDAARYHSFNIIKLLWSIFCKQMFCLIG